MASERETHLARLRELMKQASGLPLTIRNSVLWAVREIDAEPARTQAAVEAERERCAKVAEATRSSNSRGAIMTARMVAAAIRTPAEPSEPRGCPTPGACSCPPGRIE